MYTVKPLEFEDALDMGEEMGQVKQAVAITGTYFYYHDTGNLVFTSRELNDVVTLVVGASPHEAKVIAQGHFMAGLMGTIEPFFTHDAEFDNRFIKGALDILFGWLVVSEAENGLSLTAETHDGRKAKVEMTWVEGKSSGEIIQELRDQVAALQAREAAWNVPWAGPGIRA